MLGEAEAKDQLEDQLGDDGQQQQEQDIATGDEVEVVLEGHEPAKKEEQPRQRKNPVRDLRKRNKELNKENKALRRQLADKSGEGDDDDDLDKANQQQQQASSRKAATDPGPMPKLEDFAFDNAKYEQAMADWAVKSQEAATRRVLAERDEQTATKSANDNAEQAIQGHLERASSLSVSDYEAMEDKAVEVMGDQLVLSIQSTIPESEKLLYWLGKNPAEAESLAAEFNTNAGLATYKLGKIASKLSLQPKGKKKPDPELPIDGGGSDIDPSRYNHFKKLIDEAYEEGDINKVRGIRKEARAEGFDIPIE